jgi:hypothetical protein
MTAAELGRHAAIAGLCRVALAQPDGARRYYLARRAACRYFPSAAPYGSAVTFDASVVALDKRLAQARIKATAGDMRLAEFTVSYAVLNEATFSRLFSFRQRPTSPGTTSPYGDLLHRDFVRGATWAEQTFTVPEAACAGHFDGYPALPVAVLMGQLSYLAGQLVLPAEQTYRVLEGQIEAEDLCWAGETIVLRAELLKAEDRVQTFLCTGKVGEREVGRMVLKIEGGQAYAGLN